MRTQRRHEPAHTSRATVARASAPLYRLAWLASVLAIAVLATDCRPGAKKDAQSAGGDSGSASGASSGLSNDEAARLKAEEKGGATAATPPSQGPMATVPVTPAPGAPGAPAPSAPAAPGAAAPVAPAPAAAAGATPGAGSAAPPVTAKLLPIDEAKKDSSLITFRTKLVEAVDHKDKNALLAALAPNVRTDGGQGVDAFRKAWNLDAPDSPIWGVLKKALKGGTFEAGAQGGTVFVAPYATKRIPPPLSPNDYGAIIGENVNIRKEPSSQAAVIQKSTYDVVKVENDPKLPTETINGETHPWVKVILSNGTPGYVWGRFIQTGKSYHAVLEKVNGEWKVTAVTAGA